MAGWLTEEFIASLGGVIDDFPALRRIATNKLINTVLGYTRHRPHPWSTFSDYTSWRGLTDRIFLGRHLPPAVQPADLPDAGEVTKLFARPAHQRLSTKSTCLFPAFAQYLTDGFIRTNREHHGQTTSNHDIDLCPLYGRTPEQTEILREHSAERRKFGRLSSQIIDGEEYAPCLYIDNGTKRDPVFDGLDPPLLGFGPVPPLTDPAKLATLFAFGGDRANSTPFTAMMNTLLLREHNRIAGELVARNLAWDDDQVFQTSRNILIPIFIKIVVEQYINHIQPYPFRLLTDPSLAWHADWNRPNRMTVEFSLLYRWHSLMPDTIDWPADRTGARTVPMPLAQFGLDNAPLTRVGLDAAFSAAAAQPAAELGALNTNAALNMVEELGVRQGRENRLDTYNNYRRAFSLTPAEGFEDISTNRDIAGKLQDLYGSPDRVEFYAGLFAEDRVPDSPLPNLLMRMVAVDAFSQALTNPLLSEHVFNPRTFTQWGYELIGKTSSLGDLLARNVPRPGGRPIVMTRPAWRAGA